MLDRRYDRLSQAFAWFSLLLVLFVPLVVIWIYGLDAAETTGEAGGEVTVGIAVILRATARRLLRTGSSNLMRTTFGVFTRATGRAATRRIVKGASRVMIGRAVKTAADAEDEAASEESFDETAGRRVLSVLIGVAALALSFRGILALIPAEVLHEVTYEGRIGIAQASLLAALPLAAYGVLHAVFGRLWNVRIRYRTEIDGLLLQAYFTGSGSFLPLSTDIAYDGEPRDRQRVATAALAGLFLIHLLFGVLGSAFGSAALTFCGAMMLVYCFVFCFPIQPLDGSYVWRRSKLLWFGVSLPILIAFLVSLPESFGEIL
jgi:hypothetical protein